MGSLVAMMGVLAVVHTDPNLAAAQVVERQSVRVGDIEREYYLHLPPEEGFEGPRPLVINLHGFTSDARSHMGYTQFNTAADRAGMIVAYPEGLYGELNGAEGQTWEIADLNGFDDLGFMAALIDDVARVYAVDTTRVYATGFSNGGFFAFELACRMSDRVTAVASVAGQLPLQRAQTCQQSRAVPVMNIYSDTDPTVPLTGVPGFSLGGEASARFFAERYGCHPAPDMIALPDHVPEDGSTVIFKPYSGCLVGAVETVLVQDAGHTWPDAAESDVLGVTNRDINANDMIIEFFLRYTLDDDPET
ncbi:alpha/beta hydrolase family esterase [Maricaulis sp. D1M11]|uniref:alpha/beta hydrolase family esterase n=1 Tax=Maricaulis sp. D1M11 TaxID=3076117 RepID=UPI0039B50DFC